MHGSMNIKCIGYSLKLLMNNVIINVLVINVLIKLNSELKESTGNRYPIPVLIEPMTKKFSTCRNLQTSDMQFLRKFI